MLPAPGVLHVIQAPDAAARERIDSIIERFDRLAEKWPPRSRKPKAETQAKPTPAA